MEQTSATLLIGLKQDGSRRELAWTEFRRRYGPVIAGFARNLGVPTQEIDDLIQDIMLGFYSAQPRFTYDPQRGRFRGYLKTCVTHLLSRRRAAKQLPTDGRPVEQVDPVDASEDSIERAWEASWQAEQLARALEHVRQHYQDNPTFQAFHRVVIQSHEPSVVASELDVSIDTVYQAKSRCMARLRSTLKQLEDEED